MENTNATPNTQPPNNPPPGRTEGENNDGGKGDESVPYSEFKHVKDDLHRFKEQSRKAEEELKALKEKELRDKEQWKEYASAKEREAAEYRTKYETVTKSITERSKISAVREAALKLGLVETAIDDLEMMDLKDVVVETTSTGRINVMGAKSAAERIKSIRPHWFSENRSPNVNVNTPIVTGGASGAVTYEELMKLEAEAKKTGDYTEYKKKMVEFKQKK